MKNELISDELKRLFDEDQADRKDVNSIDWKVVEPKDKQRRERVISLYNLGLLISPEDKYHAAMIFQHGPRLDHIKLANLLSIEAIQEGYEPAKYLSAASEDRFLVRQGKLQRYGTQYRKNNNGNWELYAVDPSVTDEERAGYNIRPLKESMKGPRF